MIRWMDYEIFKNKLNNDEFICSYMCVKGVNKNKICCKKLCREKYIHISVLNRRCLTCRGSRGVNWIIKNIDNLPNGLAATDFNNNEINYDHRVFSGPGFIHRDNFNQIRVIPRIVIRNIDQEFTDNLNILRHIVNNIGLDENIPVKIPEIEYKIPISNNDQSDNKTINDCVICQEGKPEYVMVPCGHVCLCVECIQNKSHEKLNNKCPICRVEVMCLTKLYF